MSGEESRKRHPFLRCFKTERVYLSPEKIDYIKVDVSSCGLTELEVTSLERHVWARVYKFQEDRLFKSRGDPDNDATSLEVEVLKKNLN
jgi:hypothetical protein